DAKIGHERREADELDARAAAARREQDAIADERERVAVELAARAGELAELIDLAEREVSEIGAREATAEAARAAVVELQAKLDEARAELATRRTEIATGGAKLDALAHRRDEAARRLERVTADLDVHRERGGGL